MAIGEALLDQRAMAGIGNIWRNETLFAEQVDPYAPVVEVDDDDARPAVGTARRLLIESAGLAPAAPRRGSIARRAGRARGAGR